MDDKVLAVLLDKRGMAVSTISLAAMRDAAALGADQERERCADLADKVCRQWGEDAVGGGVARKIREQKL